MTTNKNDSARKFCFRAVFSYKRLRKTPSADLVLRKRAVCRKGHSLLCTSEPRAKLRNARLTRRKI
ncbi:MAG TPA: hypothetical protein DCE65_05395 [Clostridiales bacterium]|nr:hypothetical protein [Clostridiales bacterium]